MDTPVMEQHTDISGDDSLWITLDRQQRDGVRIVVMPNRSSSGDAPTQVMPLRPAPDPDDDLANATWEDAEWR